MKFEAITEFKTDTVYICHQGKHKGHWFRSELLKNVLIGKSPWDKIHGWDMTRGDVIGLAGISTKQNLRCDDILSKETDYYSDLEFHEYTLADEPTFYDESLWGEVNGGNFKCGDWFFTTGLSTQNGDYIFGILQNENSDLSAYFVKDKNAVYFYHGKHDDDEMILGYTKLLRPYIKAIDGDIEFPKKV